ncbi:MAG: arylesterase [Desulfuromonadales bacterium]|nr:arylesterase [Desulfuromonadales bacterium]
MNRVFPLLLVFLVLPLFAACERAPEALPEGAVILAFGDGITYGTGAGEGEGYPAVLERLVGRKVVNAGVPGETTAEGLKRLPGVLAEVRPALVILCHGGEDMIQALEADQIIANLRTMVRLIGEAGAEVLLIAVPPPAAHFQPAAFYVQISRDMKVSIEVNALSNILSRNEMRSESIYPNAQGYAALAEALAKRVKTVQR